MIKKAIRKAANKFGYDIVVHEPIDRKNGFQLYHYLQPDGTFDYDKYKEVQIKGNKQKENLVWVEEENIEFLSGYIKRNIPDVRFGLCHGTRRGKEQEWFRKYLQCEVIGTEISDTASNYPHTIEWDFHEVKQEWLGSVDFIYSNSFDHSYDPQKCLNAWMSCIKEGGICILEHSSGDEKSTELDPFGVNLAQLPYLILTWGKGEYFVTEIITAPVRSNLLKYNNFLVIRKRTPDHS